MRFSESSVFYLLCTKISLFASRSSSTTTQRIPNMIIQLQKVNSNDSSQLRGVEKKTAKFIGLWHEKLAYSLSRSNKRILTKNEQCMMKKYRLRHIVHTTVTFNS